jgi:hypothetical protein
MASTKYVMLEDRGFTLCSSQQAKTTPAERAKAPQSMTKALKPFWVLGNRAAKAGQPISACPYNTGFYEFDFNNKRRKDAWEQGWHAGNEETPSVEKT